MEENPDAIRVHEAGGEISEVDQVPNDADRGTSYAKGNTGNWWSRYELPMSRHSMKSIVWGGR